MSAEKEQSDYEKLKSDINKFKKQNMPKLSKRQVELEILLHQYDTTSVSQKTMDYLLFEINKIGKYTIEEKTDKEEKCMIIRKKGSKNCFYIGIIEGVESKSKAAEQLHPDHYKAGKMDVIHFCHHHDVNFCRGNIIKYVTRAGKKKSDNPLKEIEDLKKAKVYLDREIEKLEEIEANKQK